MKPEMLESIAKICHNVIKAYCESQGDTTKLDWVHAPDELKKVTISNVSLHLMHDANTPELAHEHWLKQKTKDGWVYGEEKNEDLKTHPCIVRFDDLPEDRKIRYMLFQAVVDSFKERKENVTSNRENTMDRNVHFSSK